MAQGVASDLASTTLLATDKRVLVAPGDERPHVAASGNSAERRDFARRRRGVRGPRRRRNGVRRVRSGPHGRTLGDRRCDRTALLQPTVIPLPESPPLRGPLSGRHVVVTAGPTFEPIDPVRFIGNRSSGRQGFALAEAAVGAGARVTLISGPVALPDPPGASMVRVETARQMLEAALAALPADVFIGAAAVADWRVDAASGQKLKKGARGAPSLSLVENPDILAQIAATSAARPKLVVGFAAETENVIENAKQQTESQGMRSDRRQQRGRWLRRLRRRRE